MGSYCHFWRHSFKVACWALVFATVVPVWMQIAAQESDPDEIREKSVVDRFVTVLEKNPRRGTALDKVYGFHVERGSLNGLIKTYRDKTDTAKKTDAASAWMIVGLLESLRGQDAASVDAFGKAEQLDPSSYLASYYLGLSQVLIGQPDKAAEALERATQRKPAQADQLDVFQALGRVYQRAQKSEKALEVWNRLEKQFPNDARVQEQIATTLLEEGEFASALPRFENLAKTTKDKYRQSLFQMEAAEIKVRLGKPADAIKEFESLLGQLNPDNWLYREVRRRIENVYLRTDDQAGLIAYYETWMKKNPNDLGATTRIAHLLAGLGRGPEAQQWLEAALKIAPTNKELRRTLIAQLMYEQKFADVIAHYEQLDKHEPNNPDTLREWGRVILKDASRDQAARKKDATAVWQRMTASKPKDPLVASQVAELFRQVEMTDEALKLYQTAVTLAPEAAQYKEYLGEYFHSLKRKDEALATWRQIAEGNAKTAANLARLAEVLSSFGYLAEAVETNAEACKLDPKDINLQIKRVDLLAQVERHDEALKQLDVVKKLAASDEEREAWLGRELKELSAIDKLKDRMTDLHKELDERKVDAGATEKSKTELADKWYWLARSHEFERQLKEAAQAITKAGELAPQSIPILTASGRIQEASNNLLAAVEINTKLAAVDRRYRTEYLKKVAQLELQLGRREKGIQAGRDLIAAAPGNPELYEFFSQLCFQLGETEEGLQALRRSVRVNPTEPKGLLLLANALGDQFRTSEAIELYWRAFDKAATLDDRLGIVPKLAELYLQTNQLDRLLERLERQRREPNQQREMTICLAQAYQSAGDDGNARQELEKLLTDDTRDIQLLQQLVKLCETDGDLDMAVRYQQQMNKSSPGKEGIVRLAQLLNKAGEPQEAAALMAQLTADENNPEAVLKSIDSLLNQKQFEQALAIVQKLTREQPKNWELLYREGVILARTKPDEAAGRFDAIIAMKSKDDEPGVVAQALARKAAAMPRGQNVTLRPVQPQRLSLQIRIQATSMIRQAVDENSNRAALQMQQQQQFWTPGDYGQARIASFAWKMRFAQSGGRTNDLFKEKIDTAGRTADRRDLLDAYYLAVYMGNQKEAYRCLKQLSLRPDADQEIHQLYLYSLQGRGTAGGDAALIAEGPADATDPDDVADFDPDVDRNGNRIALAPLDKDELEHVIALARMLESPAEINRQRRGYSTFIELAAAELRRSGRKAEARRMIADVIDNAKDASEIGSIFQGAVQRGDYNTAIRMLDRLAALGPNPTAQTNSLGINYPQYASTPDFQAQQLAQLMMNRARAKNLDDVLGLWNRYVKLVVAREAAAPTAQSIAAKRQQRSAMQFGGNQYINIWHSNGQQRGEQLDFPTPNEVFDLSSIQLLRQAFSFFREADQSSQLTKAFAVAVKDPQTPESHRKIWQFGLGYLHWWNDEKDEALAVLNEASQQIPNNNEIKFEMARLHEKRREFSEALELIDAITPGDQAALQQREVMALRVSVNGGNIDRARLAAERLFGLRLDPNLQLALAHQMHQLGMHEQAEAVLARAGRQAGNKTEILGSLMEQYASAGKNDVAIQIAHQLLRRSKANSNSVQTINGRIRMANQGNDGLRTQALQVLNRSGKLPEMIAKVESQLKSSPKSTRLLETLLEYSVAAGNEKKVEEVNARLAEFKNDDPKFKLQLAMKLLDAGRTKEANEHLKAVFEKDPNLLMTSFSQLRNKYMSQNKMEDLASLYESIDMKVFVRQPTMITNVINNLSMQEQTRPRALSLFKKAWIELPEARNRLLASMRDENFWKLPEVYDYVREGIIPTEATPQQTAFSVGMMSYNTGGKITTLNTRALDVAASQKKLDDLGEEIAAALKRIPSWTGGKILLGLIDLRKGKVSEAKATFETMLPTLTTQEPRNSGVVANQVVASQVVAGRSLREIGQELMVHDECADLAIRYFEAAILNTPDEMNDFQFTVGKPLFDLLKKRGRNEEARQLLINGTKPINQNMVNQPDYEAYRRLANAVSFGKELQELGYPVDAIKIYQKALSNPEDLVLAQQWGDNQPARQLKEGLSKSLEQLKPEYLAELLAPPVKPANAPKPNPAPAPPGSRRNPVVVEESTEDFNSVNLIVGVDSQDLAKAQMTSALVNLVTGISKKPQLLETTVNAVADARTRRPDDFGAAILATQLAIGSEKQAARKAGVDDLVAMTDRLPLEPPTDKGRFTAKHRAAAMQQAQLWLVARECLTNEELRASGEKLAIRALEAGNRLSDDGYALAIVREWGQIALGLGDPKTAEQKWTEMLDLVIPKPGAKPKNLPDPDAPPVGRVTRRVMTSNGQASVITSQVAMNADAQLPAGTKGHAVTLAQFLKAAQIAKMAADNGLNDLSLRAIEQSLHAGPPLEAMQDVQQANNPFGAAAQINDQSPSVIQVQQQLAAIEQVWRRNGVADERVYLALRGTMLPETRPLEVFLYPQPLSNSRVQAPQSIGALVVRAALKANQSDDLKQRLETKLAQPLGALPARVALTQLALAKGDKQAAGEQLDLIAERIKLDSVVNTSELACHAALPAIDSPELTPRAIVIVERAADHYSKNEQSNRNSVEEPIRSFRFKLAELQFRGGNVEAGKKHLAAWATQLASMWSNYGGDYPQYRRKSEYLSVAAAYARYGQQTDSLEFLGRHADLPLTSNYGEQPIGLSGAVILSGLAQLPPAEQYTVLKQWSLPLPERRSVRLMLGLMAGDNAPVVFDSARDGIPRLSSVPRILSSADLLVRSAAATGKLDELRRELEPFAAENLENAQFLLMLTRLAQPDDAKIAADLRAWFDLRKAADVEADKNPGNNRRSRRPDATNAIIAQAAIAHQVTREVGLELCLYQLERYTRFSDQLHIAYMRHLYNSSVIGDEQSARMDRSPYLVDQKHWTGSAHTTANAENSGATPMWWLAHDGKLQHVCGPGQGYLFFNYPLTGTFEFSCDIWFGSWADGSTGYGGLVFDTLNSCQIFPIGRREHSLSKPNALDTMGKYNRFSIQVTPNSIKNFCNGALTHEEATSGGTTTPWLFLHAERDWQTAFTNLRITGQPTIPDEVSLSGSPTLLGWSGAFYGETLPAHFAKNPDAANPPNQQQVPGEPDWLTVDGEIRGRQLAPASLLSSSVLQSRLQYHRPLRNGEKLSYEFWYEPAPGSIHVHPAMDRMAMVLEPEGVKLHWMTETNDDTWLNKGLPATNLVENKEARRGPARLPLKPQAWNRVDLALKDDTIAVSLNGALIFERPMEPENNRQFSLYHDKHSTSVRVRNVVLKGDWPKSLTRDVLDNLMTPAHPHSPVERQRLARLFDDKYEIANLDAVLQSTRGLSLADRYTALKNWVLPNDDHSTIRVYGDTAPSDPTAATTRVLSPVDIQAEKSSTQAQPAAKTKPAGSSLTGSDPVTRRVRSGGELIGPALDLVAVAKELGTLDELAAAVRSVPESSAFVKRSRLAMLALIAISANDAVTASATLKELSPPRDKGLSDDLPANERWPELIVACEATQIPELRAAAVALLDLVLDSVNRKGIGYGWDVKVRSAKQHAMLRLEKNAELPLASAISPKGQWAQVTMLKATNRAGGMVPRWRFQGTDVSHLGGDGNDLIYFQSPMRGKFTVEGELSTFGWREVRPMYAALWAGPQYTLELADIGNLTSNWNGPKFPAKLEPMGEWYRMKLEVTPDKATYYANEQVIHEQSLSDHADPWLALYCYGHYAAALRSLRILGEPEIPTELPLSKRDDLQGWWSDMYSDPITGDNAKWKKNGDEITGTKLGGWNGRSRESLLQYHRPMLEDGDISYEFYYVPDQTHVHPAFGRMVMLLDPDGVKVHWLTDAQFERGGLAQDNVSLEPEHRRNSGRLALKDNNWNTLNLSLRGNTVSLALNGEAIYERPLEAENLRTFGLFHYAGDTDVRVKNVVYRGNWPQKLPSVDEQELAGNDMELATFKEDELPDTWSCNFKGPRPGVLTQTSTAPTNKYSSVDGGLHLVREPNSDAATDSAGLRWLNLSIEGDFEVTLGYRDFQSQTKNDNHQVPRVEIILALGGTFNGPQHSQTLALTHRRRHDNNMHLTSIHGIRRNPPAEDWLSSDRQRVRSEGRIRIVRRSGMAYYLYSNLGSDDWELLDRRPVSTASVKDLIIGLRGEDLMGSASVTLTEFSIRAQRLQYRPEFGKDELPARYSWNFQGPLPDSFQALSANVPNKFEPVADGIKIVRPEDPKQPATPVGFNWLGNVYGDFEVTLSYHDFESASDKMDWQNPRIEIKVPIGGPEWTPAHKFSVFALNERKADGSMRVSGGMNERKPDNQFAWKGDGQAATAATGRLRVIRQGRRLFTLAAAPGSDDFKVTFSAYASDDEVKSVGCTICSESLVSRANVVFTEFSIRAQSFDAPNATKTTSAEKTPAPPDVAAPVAGPAPFGARDLPAKITWNFQGPRPRFFTEWGTKTKNQFVTEKEGIRVLRAAKVETSDQAVGYLFNGGLDGDFEITLDYRDFASTAVLKDWQVPRVDLSVVIHSNANAAELVNSAGVAHRRNHDGVLRLLASQGDKGSDGKMVYKSTESKTDRVSGRLRLVRQETTIYFQSAASGSDDWFTFRSGTIDPGPVKWLGVGLRAEDLDASGEVLLTNITIRANAFLPK